MKNNKINEMHIHMVSKEDMKTQLTVCCNVNAPIEEIAPRVCASAIGTGVVEVVYDGDGYNGVPVIEASETNVEANAVPAVGCVSEPIPQYGYGMVNAYQMPMMTNCYGYLPPFSSGFIPANCCDPIPATSSAVLARISASIKGRKENVVEEEEKESAPHISTPDGGDGVENILAHVQNAGEERQSIEPEDDTSDVCEDTVILFLKMIKTGNMRIVDAEDFVYKKSLGYKDEQFFYINMDPAFTHFSETVKFIDPKRELVDPVKIEQYLFQRGYVEPENEATRRYRKRVTVVTEDGTTKRKRFLWIKKNVFELLETEEAEIK